MGEIGARCIALVDSDPAELMASSSGGAFSILARDVLARGGAVYGHAFDGGLRVGCVRVDSVEGLAGLRGSKYVQSDMGGSMGSVLADLEVGVPVLFSGTPARSPGSGPSSRQRGPTPRGCSSSTSSATASRARSSSATAWLASIPAPASTR